MLDLKARGALRLTVVRSMFRTTGFLWLICAVVLALGAHDGVAQRSLRMTSSAEFPVVMLSDLHFDPLHDPAKVPLLTKAPLSQWKAILDRPNAPEQEARFAAIQEACNAKDGTDTPYALLQSSLSAAKAQSPTAGFITVSGDLLVHDLDCRYRSAIGLPASNTDDQSVSASFAEKTTIFVMNQVESTFPNIPVYVALGNNDSRCNHNRMDSHDEYLKASVSAMLTGLRGVNASEKALARRTYLSAGYYAVNLPTPMLRTRLIVINDIYMMPKYANCEAVDDGKGEQEQTAWLQKELDSARHNKYRVWVMGHLPPTVNADSSLSSKASFCTTGKTVRYQATEELANQIMANANTIKLGIFGHTHMDEFHLLRGQSSGVPIKIVASITPVSGSLPSFTVGTVDGSSATLTNFSVYEASNATGVDTRWKEEYTFNSTYRVAGFSADSLSDVIRHLQADKDGTSKESRDYKEHFLKSSSSKKLSSSWQGYACSLDNPTAQSFKDCVCKAQ